MKPDRDVIGDIFSQLVRRARAMGLEEKLLAGGRLFDRSFRIMSDGIRREFSSARDEKVLDILRRRLALAR